MSAGFVYCLSHVAWSKIGMVKVGMTARDPARRAAEICSSSGLYAPAKVEFCLWVDDCRAVELAVKHALGRHRVRGRELFRTDVATVRAAIESAQCSKRVVVVQQPRDYRAARRRRGLPFSLRYVRWGRVLSALAGLWVLWWIAVSIIGALLRL